MYVIAKSVSVLGDWVSGIPYFTILLMLSICYHFNCCIVFTKIYIQPTFVTILDSFQFFVSKNNVSNKHLC
jgi:hypothetical protein